MPHAIERSLATPMTRPRLPAISRGTSGSSTALEGVWLATGSAVPTPEPSGAAESERSSGMVPSVVVAREEQTSVRAAEAEAVRHHRLKTCLVDALTGDRIVARSRIEVFNVGRRR